MRLKPTSYFLSNQIGSIYSAVYMSKARLAWSQGMAVSGRSSVPGQRSPLVAARLHPLQDSIRHLCGTKDISSLFFLCVMVSTWHHPRKECVLMTTGLQAIHIMQVRAIFKLPDHLGHYPHPLAYVEWFTSLRRCEPISGQFLVTRSTCEATQGGYQGQTTTQRL